MVLVILPAPISDAVGMNVCNTETESNRNIGEWEIGFRVDDIRGFGTKSRLNSSTASSLLDRA